MPPLSIFIIAQNEADRIGRTIEAARGLSDDIVLVDSGSTDGTQALAEALGARVIFNAWPGYGQQKRFAEEQCRHDWLLNLDADEVVPPDLAAEISALFAAGTPPKDAYKVRIAEIFPGEGAHSEAIARLIVKLEEIGYFGDYSFDVYNTDYLQMPAETIASRAQRSAEWLGETVLRRTLPVPNLERLRLVKNTEY